jgi:predicted Fe-Mo cluster-binding NifX family protein
VRSAGARELVCGGLTGCVLQSLETEGLSVRPWTGGTAEEVARAWAAGRLDDMRMPGCACPRAGARPACCRKRQHKEKTMSKNIIAITSEGPKLSDMVDPRFGRAAGFVIVDLDSGAHSFVDNGGSQVMAQGAGIQAAENVSKAGASVVLSGYVGPKAFQALTVAGIRVVQDVENMTVAQAVEKYRGGAFADSATPKGRPHSGGAR